MAKDSEGAFDKELVLKALLKCKSQGGEMNFAFGLAAKPENCGLLVHIRKPGGVLKKEVKSGVGIKKACFGTLTVDGAEVLLKPVKPLKGIVKQLKRKFREEKLTKFRPVLVDLNGNFLDEDTLPDPDDYDDSDDPVTGAESGAGEEVVLDPAALKARLLKAASDLKALGATAPPKLAAGIAAAAKSLKGGDLQGCAATLDKIEEALAGIAPSPASDAQADTMSKLRQALSARVALIKALPEGAQRTKLGAMARAASQTLNSGDVAATVQALKELSSALKAGPEVTQSADVLEIWRDAKESVDEGITKLQSALRENDHPALSRIADLGLNGVTEGNQTALAKALFEFKAASGAQKAKSARALEAQVAVYAKFLASDPVLDLVENNPFGVSLPLRSTLGTALRQIAQACKAAA